jgi:lysozyme family protein
MISNFLACSKLTVDEEGGYDLNPRDRGNWTSGVVGVGTLKGTRYGISAAAYPRLDIANLTLASAQGIYMRDYFTRAGCDRLPIGVDAVVFDMAVNAGVDEGVRLLQQVVGTPQDGKCGPHTCAAANSIDPSTLIRSFTAVRLAFYEATAANNRDETEDLQGWKNRASAVQAAALAMAAATSTQGPMS